VVVNGHTPLMTLILDEQFTDLHNWVAELGGGGWGDAQLQTYGAASAAIVGGQLAITARSAGGVITSARLTTKERFAFRYGRVEARIRVAAGDGMWPAFWMLGTDIDEVGWPACGEIDVMEVVSSEPTTLHGTVHGPGFAGVGLGVGHAHDTGMLLSDDFHVYAVEWQATRISWLLDGSPYFTVTRDELLAWPFDHEFFLMLNLAVGGSWPGLATEPSLPATMLVDWVRVTGP
jgi:beta-glucanase (GH16 family)